ncbi:MAG TPA: DsbA family oxidoreductase [Alphaproteobacteria bacterium]|nr:DsbA family oxidoreductase [Alphaproteobacteria bacterium]
MNIDIISDTICPWCFIGKRRLERALTISPQPGAQVLWHPFQLNPDMPAEGMERREYLRLKFGDEHGATTYDAIRDAGADEGIEFNFGGIRRTPNTLQSHRMVRYAGLFGLQHQVVEALFQAYFVDGQDVSDRLTLLDLGAGAGLERGPLADYLESDEGTAEVNAEDRMARQIGVQGVPCFIFERKYVVSGAQAPEIFLKVFDLVAKDAGAAPSEPEV